MQSTVTYSLSLLVRGIPPLLLSHAANTTLGRLDQGRPPPHRLRVVERLHHSLQERTLARSFRSVLRHGEWQSVGSASALEKKPEKCGKSWHVFRWSISGRFQPHLHHNSTTIYRAIHHVLHIKKAKSPRKTPLSPRPKKTTKYNVKGIRPSQWRRPAAAHTQGRLRSPSRRP